MTQLEIVGVAAVFFLLFAMGVAYFMRMSLATEVTPLISRARTVALSMSARELTKPLS